MKEISFPIFPHVNIPVKGFKLNGKITASLPPTNVNMILSSYIWNLLCRSEVAALITNLLEMKVMIWRVLQLSLLADVMEAIGFGIFLFERLH